MAEFGEAGGVGAAARSGSQHGDLLRVAVGVLRHGDVQNAVT
ncbi:hypothetical protein ACWCQL_27105 [Streptomyces sp. NPDC002073]